MSASPRRHHHRHHRHQPGCCPNPAEGIDPDLLTEVNAARQQLTRELDRLGDPIKDAFDALRAEEFASLVWRTRNPDRTRFLNELGVPSGKRPTNLAASNGLTRLRTWPPERRLRAAVFLTNPLVDALEQAWIAWYDRPGDDAPILAALTSGHSLANSHRLMILAHLDARPESIAALRIGLGAGLALPIWPQDAVSDVCTACQLAEDAWKQIRDRVLAARNGPRIIADSTPENDTEDAIGTDVSIDSAPLGSSVAPTLPSSHPFTPDRDAVAMTEEVVSANTCPSGDLVSAEAAHVTVAQTSGAAFTDIANQLVLAQTAACDAAANLVELITQDGIPKSSDLEPLTAFTTTADQARQLLARSGRADPDVLTVGHLLTDLAWVANATEGQERRSRLARLARLIGPEDLHEAISDVQALTAALVATSTWGDEQQRHADGLETLLELITRAGTGDTTALAALHTRTQQHLPARLAPVIIAAVLGRLSVPPAADQLALAHNSDTREEAGFGLEIRNRQVKLPLAAIATENIGPDQRSYNVRSAELATAASHESTGAPTAAATLSPDGPGHVTPGVPSVPTLRRSDEARHPGDDEATAALGHERADEPATAAASASDEATQPSEPAQRSGSDVEDGVGTRGTELIRSLLRENRFSLAFHAASASNAPRRADALRILALASAARSENAPTSGALRGALEEELRTGAIRDRTTQLLLIAGAVRACLVTADPTAGETVATLTSTLGDMPSLASMITAIGNASAQGLLYSTTILTTLAPIADADNDIATTVETAAAERRRRRNLDFVRANLIADRWWSRSGLIGSLLEIAATDRRGEVETAATELRKLAKREDLVERLMREDVQVRATSGSPLQGKARRKLLEQARTSLEAVRAWVETVRASGMAGQHQHPAPPALTDLRHQVRTYWSAAEQELAEIAFVGEPSLAAAADACRASLGHTVRLLDGTGLSGPDRDPAAVLNQDLLCCPQLPFDTDLTPLRTVTLDDVIVATQTSWSDAFDARLHLEDYAGAALILNSDPLIAAGHSQTRTMRDKLTISARRSHDDLRILHRQVAAQVEKAARLGQLDEAASTTVHSQLEATAFARDEDATVGFKNLGVTRRQLDEIRHSLPFHAEQAQHSLRKRVEEELTRSTAPISDRHRKAIDDRIDAGDLATAEEYLLAALAGDVPPTAEPSGDLAAFLTLAEQLPQGITDSLIAAIRNGDAVAGVDGSALSLTERAVACDGLQAWVDLRNEHHNKITKSALTLTLRLAGIEFSTIRPLPEFGAGQRRTWRELLNVKRIGETLVPAFGSKAGDRQRLMLCWGSQDVRTLMAWVAQDHSDTPAIIAVFGVLTAMQRTTLAMACAEHPDKPVIVLDDIALIYLALNGAGQFSALERILLPFAATNPYHPYGNANVPSEMFYGRKKEQHRIVDPHGPNLLYGGRQLGKTALLQAAARRFEMVTDSVAVYVSLPNGVGVTVNPDVLWDLVLEKLAERKILPPRRTKDAVKNVKTAVTAWLAAGPTRRLLMLIDECDRFFDADAETDFSHTTQLRNLMNDTARRFKPVFAGLHQVQRFAHLPNQPLVSAHLGEQIAIGPLGPDPAYRLLFTPMEVLGIRFASDELIHRVLAYCNYQPKLLQLVGEALVGEALRRRRGGPPYDIAEHDLDRVIGSEAMRQKVRETVQLTLNLDSRYKLIALVVAFAACEHGADRTISFSNLREDCQGWWPQEFVGQRTDEFASLLEEMRDLGVLATSDGQWRLRSSNVLRLLGSAADIETELCSTEWRTTVTKLSAEQARRRVEDGLVSPFTEQQLSRLTERGNHLRVVVGTPATGVNRVRTLLEEAKGFGARFKLQVSTSPSHYRRDLRAGTPGEMHRVVVSDLTNAKIDAILDALDSAQRNQPQPGVTRTVVVVVDAAVAGVLDAVSNPCAGTTADQLMPLRRVSSTGLRSWLADNDQMSCFGDASSHAALLTVTGGWPMLLDHAASRAQEVSRPQRICTDVTALLATPGGADRLLEAVGIRAIPAAAAAFGVLVDYADPVTTEELITWCAEAGSEPAHTAQTLRILDVITQRESDGLWEPEPVVAAAWRLLHQS